MARLVRSRRAGQEATRFGVGEWYARVVSELEPRQRAELATKAKLNFKKADMPCPFKQSSEGEPLCNKNGGVCSLIPYSRGDDNRVIAAGKFVTVCPNR
jgi:hypothetical protein